MSTMTRVWRRFFGPATVVVGLGIPTVASAGSWESRQIAGMTTQVYTPDTDSPIGSGRALMIGLHGCSQTGDQLRQHGNFELAAEEFGVVIALPNVPGGGVIAGCWNYYGSIHTRQSGHNAAVIGLAEALRDDGALGIDSDQVYLAGFSAGGGQALVVGCLAPEVFAGVGVAAGPAVGTTVNDIPQVGTTAQAAATLCRQYAGGNASAFDSQLAVAFTDTTDFTVAQGYAQVNADMYVDLFEMSGSPADLDVTGLEGSSPAGQGKLYSDGDGPRVTWMHTMGTGHNWPAGSGSGGGGLTFVSGTGLNFSYYLADFFGSNSRRAGGMWPGGDSGAGDAGDEAGDEAGDGAGSGGADGGDGGDAGSGGGGGGEGGSGPGGGQGDDGRIEPSGCQCAAGGDRWSAGLLWAISLVVIGIRRRP